MRRVGRVALVVVVVAVLIGGAAVAATGESPIGGTTSTTATGAGTAPPDTSTTAVATSSGAASTGQPGTTTTTPQQTTTTSAPASSSTTTSTTWGSTTTTSPQPTTSTTFMGGGQTTTTSCCRAPAMTGGQAMASRPSYGGVPGAGTRKQSSVGSGDPPAGRPAGRGKVEAAGARVAIAAAAASAPRGIGSEVSRDLAPLVRHLPLGRDSAARRRMRQVLPPAAGILGLALCGVAWDQHRKTLHVERARQAIIARARTTRRR